MLAQNSVILANTVNVWFHTVKHIVFFCFLFFLLDLLVEVGFNQTYVERNLTQKFSQFLTSDYFYPRASYCHPVDCMRACKTNPDVSESNIAYSCKYMALGLHITLLFVICFKSLLVYCVCIFV